MILARKIVLFITLLLTVTSSRADLPPKNAPYTLRSANDRYVLRSIPYKLFGRTGKTYVYDTRNDQMIYSMDIYLPDMSYLSDNGLSIATVSYWGGHNIPVSDSVSGQAVAFYYRGKETRSYEIMDLVEQRSKLIYSVSHAAWKYDERSEANNDKHKKELIRPELDSIEQCIARNNTYMSNDTLYITTVEKKVLIFYMPTGLLIIKSDATRFFRKKGTQFNFRNPSRERLEGYNGPPHTLPELIGTSTSFQGSLADFLKIKPAAGPYNCDILTRFTLLVDRETGEFIIKKILVWKKMPDQPDEKGDINFKDGETIKQKILDWLKDKKFDTKDFPSWIEKWEFDNEYYFTFQ